MSDREYELYVEKKHARAEGLEEGRVKGLEIGREEGRAEGRAEGREEGRAEGREEGADNKAREMAAGMLAEGDSVEKVVRISKLTEADVLAIKARLPQ